MSLKSFDVVGYTLDGNTYCVPCFDELDKECDNPCLAGDETDHQLSCHSCLEIIGSSVLNKLEYQY